MDISLVYALLGEEELLKESALSKIKQKCFPRENESSLSFNYVSLEGKSVTSARVIDECQQLPFMGNIRLAVVKDAEKILDDKFIRYFENPVKTTCLVLLIRKIDKRLTIYKTIHKFCSVQEFDHPDIKETTEWILQYIQNRKKRISPRDASHIAGILENNLIGISNELEKLITYMGDRETITEKDIESIISENKFKDSFALTKAIQNKDTQTAIILVNTLLDQGNPVPMIIGSLRWMLLRLWTAKDILAEKGRSALSSELRIPPFFIREFAEQVEKFTTADLKNGLIKLLSVEKILRSYTIPDNLVLETLVIQLTENTTALVKA